MSASNNMAEFDAIFHYITWVFHHFVFPLKFKFSNELTSSKIKVKIDEKVLPFLHKFKTWQRYQILIDRKIILKEVSIKLYTNEGTFLLSNIMKL